MTRRLNLSRVAGGGDRNAGKISFALSGDDLQKLKETDVVVEAPLPPETRARLSREEAHLRLAFDHPDLGSQDCRLDLSGLEDHAVYECEILWNTDRVILKLIPSPEDDDPQPLKDQSPETS